MNKINMFFKLLLIIIFVLVSHCSSAYAFGNSLYEIHHIFPQRYFNSLGDTSCFELREYEHKWIETSGGYKNDWTRCENGRLITPDFYNKEGITSYGARSAAITAGMRILSYHLFTVDYNSSKGKNNSREISGLLAWKLDAWSNLMYNVGYIFSTPSKIIHFLAYAIPRHDTFYDNPSILYLVGWTLWQAVSGIILAVIMLIVGTIIGVIAHPLWTLGGLLFAGSNIFNVNLITTITWLIYAAIESIANIFFWV